jgi:HEAT repeats/SMI1 / KNR4 family (SUKH-1)
LDCQPQIGRIVEKLQRVRRAEKPSFGAETHRFFLAEPIGEEAILLFENQHGVRLPEDYRQFLMLAGGSGGGPYYGILPLDKWDDANGGRNTLPADYLARPCPLVPGTKAKLTARANSESGVDPRDELLQGSIALAHQGCSYYSILIVSGEARGRVAYISLDDPEYVYFPENLNFLSWYERWLDELLAGYNTMWFGYGALGTEEELALRLKDPAISADDKSAALRTLIRIDPLTHSTMEILSDYSKDTNEGPTPRATAASLFISRSADPVYVRLLLQDSCAQIRKEVLLAVVRKKSPMLKDAVRQLIHDPDSTVVDKALLHGKGILTRSEIAPFLKSENVDLRRTAIYSLGGSPNACVEELLALAFSEADQYCRIYAIQALRDLKNRAARAPLEKLLKRETDALVRTNILRALENLDKRSSGKSLKQ